MNKQEKGQLIEELSEKLSQTTHFYVADTGGLTVAQINAFRRLCFDKGLEYKVVKNSLIQKALEKQEADFSKMYDSLKGFSGILFSPEVGNAPAKVIKEFRKKNNSEKPLFKAAAIDTDVFVGEENLTFLSELKSKQELLGDVIGLLQSPAKNVISALQSGGHKVAGIVKALEERAQ
ncbi:50S ribosomal protein L10 [Marivirga lumbricoides]|uniref:Large ribosomal subunit protein uL10 n=1 Tax=Marivirga lumbricoides TaxID=1046115 RepID=A0ABQ1LP06_9BACT|nr:50S ribosomal protein L10 [Marivirga lumbricoides]